MTNLETKNRLPITLAVIALSLLMGCTLPPQYSATGSPPPGQVLIYVYLDDLSETDKSSLLGRKDFLTPSYQLTGFEPKRLTGGISHRYVSRPGQLKIHHYLPHEKTNTYPVAANANDTVFVEFKLLKQTQAGKPRFQQQVFIFKQTASSIQRAQVHLQDTRVASFYNNENRRRATIADRQQQPRPTDQAEPENNKIASTTVNESRIHSKSEIERENPGKSTTLNIDNAGSDSGSNAPVENKLPAANVLAETTSKPSPSQPNAESSAAPNTSTAGEPAANELAGGDTKNTPVAPESNYLVESRTSIRRVSCSKPYTLTRDCKGNKLANREVTINGNNFLAAGSTDGSVVMVLGKPSTINALKQFATFGTAASNEARKLDNSWPVLRALLQANGINVLVRTTIITSGDTAGYIIQTDGNAYALIN